MTGQDMGPGGQEPLRHEPTPPVAPPPPASVATAPGAVAATETEREREVRPTAADRRHNELRRLRGFNLGAALFGWLIVVGIAVLLSSLLAAGGAAIGLTQSTLNQGASDALSITGAVLLGIVLILAYYAGGYVAGRLSRFSGALQGLGVWLIGLIITAALAVVGLIAGSKYNILVQLRLPSIPVNGQTLVSGALVTLVAIVIATLLAAVFGGRMGLRYHHRVDRALDRA